ncbi:MAG: DNA-binding protein [Ignavibacteria bacterium CG22_combo_CG10-13_8_21_14_all_37_15]|nr:MAG: DNA-binding protein [Ignavibacteria bacterium CG22_combo_CG10-13_8_21_14_all_37_15]
MMQKFKPPEEWFLQAEYDMDTADAMFQSGRYTYAVFMSHLCIEKALKGFYAKVHCNDAPKTRNLLYLLELMNAKEDLIIPDEFEDFFKILNEKSVPTRYPDMLFGILKEFKKTNTKHFITKGKKVLKWIKEKSV